MSDETETLIRRRVDSGIPWPSVDAGMVSVPSSVTWLFRGRFGLADVGQQVVGGFILAGPFVVTQEVWDMAKAMSWLQGGVTVLITLGVGYAALFGADERRTAERESAIAGVPNRFISLIVVSYLTVTFLAYTFAAPKTFSATDAQVVRAIALISFFAVVGAATADSIF